MRVDQDRAAPGIPDSVRKAAVLTVVCAAQFMVVLDISVVNVALPSIRTSLGLSDVALGWVVNAYALVFAGLLLLGGRLADLFGRRRMLLAGLGVFAAASLAGGLADSGAWLIGARAVQGLGAAVTAPVTLAILTATFAEGRARTRALAVWTALGLAGGTAGNLLGGVLTEWGSWRSTLLINVPIALVAIIVAVAGIAITSQSVARERELGTFDQLMVSPLRVHEILIGKMVPPFLVGMFNGSLYLIIAPLVFGVPFTGSYLLFFLALAVYLLALIGVGMLVSAASATQQQAFLGSFLATVPLILLSGYAAPIDNMPAWLQTVTYADPARYFLILVQGLFLKAMPAAQVFEQLWPLVVIACATLAASAWLFRARME